MTRQQRNNPQGLAKGRGFASAAIYFARIFCTKNALENQRLSACVFLLIFEDLPRGYAKARQHNFMLSSSNNVHYAVYA